MNIKARQIPIIGWCGTELHVQAQIVSASLAVVAHAAGDAWLNGYTIAWGLRVVTILNTKKSKQKCSSTAIPNFSIDLDVSSKSTLYLINPVYLKMRTKEITKKMERKLA